MKKFSSLFMHFSAGSTGPYSLPERITFFEWKCNNISEQTGTHTQREREKKQTNYSFTKIKNKSIARFRTFCNAKEILLVAFFFSFFLLYKSLYFFFQIYIIYVYRLYFLKAPFLSFLSFLSFLVSLKSLFLEVIAS